MVKMFKLLTGEEVIADSEKKETKYILKNPVGIVPTQGGKMAFVPYTGLLKDNVIEIDEKFIVFQGEIEQEIENVYNAQFNNGIVLANAAQGAKLHLV